MTATNHALTGAVIALVVKKPELAIPLAFVSHFALDMIPHFGYKDNVDFGTALKHKLTKYVVALDPLLFIIFLGLLLHYSAGIWIYVAAFVAMIPDFEWLLAYYGFERRGNKPWRSVFAKFHSNIQWCERLWGGFVEIAWYLGGLWLLSILLR